MNARRKAGSGSITLLPSGHFRVRVRGGGRLLFAGTVATRAEAESARRGALALLAEEQTAPTGSMTLAQWADVWFSERARDGFRGIEEDRSLWRNRIATSDLATIPLKAITRQHVRDWIEATRKITVKRHTKDGRVIDTKRPPKISSLRRMRAVLRSMLAAAVERGMLDANPAGGFPIRSPSTAPSWTYLSRAEVDALITHDLIPTPFRLLYTVAIFTGLRRGELWALRWRDVDLDGDRPQIHVRGSHSGPTKTGRERIVPLLPRAVAALRRWHEITRYNEPDQHVFASGTGARRAKADRAMWGRNGQHPGYRVVAGIQRPCSFHAFRHTCASALLQGYWGPAWRIEDVSLMLGHSSLTVTARYAHLSSEYLHERVRDLRAKDTTVESGTFPAAAEPIRACSITTKGSGAPAEENRSKDPLRVPDVSFAAEALVEAVATGRGVDAALALLVEHARNTEFEPLAMRCAGVHRIRRALDLATEIRIAARANAPNRGAAT